MRAYLSSFAVLALTTGCIGWDGQPNRDIQDLEWRAVEIAGDRASVTEVRPSMLLTRQGQASGSTSCNRWFGPYRLEGNVIRFGQIGSTRVRCEGLTGAQEKAFLATLQSVSTYKLRPDGVLILATPKGQRIIFRR
jgi:heat shock protein HslJ